MWLESCKAKLLTSTGAGFHYLQQWGCCSSISGHPDMARAEWNLSCLPRTVLETAIVSGTTVQRWFVPECSCLVLWFWLSRPYWKHFKHKFYLGIKGSLGAEAAALAFLLLEPLQAQLGPNFISYGRVIWYDSGVEVAVVWSYRLKRRQRRSFACAGFDYHMDDKHAMLGAPFACHRLLNGLHRNQTSRVEARKWNAPGIRRLLYRTLQFSWDSAISCGIVQGRVPYVWDCVTRPRGDPAPLARVPRPGHATWSVVHQLGLKQKGTKGQHMWHKDAQSLPWSLRTLKC